MRAVFLVLMILVMSSCGDKNDMRIEAQNTVYFENATSQAKWFALSLVEGKYTGKVPNLKGLFEYDETTEDHVGKVDKCEVLNVGTDFKGDKTPFIKITHKDQVRIIYQDGTYTP